jgi:outer membrane protein, heavy metal efflux system
MSRAPALFLVAWAGMLVSGCVSYQPEPISPEANARALESRSLNDPRLRQFIALALRPDSEAAAEPTWDLTTLTLAAVYYHPDLEVAHAKLAAAQAAVITAQERPNPVLNFTNIVGQGLVAGAIPAGAAPLTIGPAVDFLIETFGKREARTAQAEVLAEAARFDVATAAWQVRSRVRTALLALWAAERRLTLTRQRFELEDQLVSLLEQRQAAGEASALDVSRERINRGEITLAVNDLELSAAEARVQLATAIGIPAQALDGVNLAMNVFDHPPAIEPKFDAAAWRREALTQRSDVQASLENFEATQEALRLAIADQYPNVTLGPGYSYQYGINQYQLDFATTLPIFNQNQGAIAEALARRQQAAAAFTALQAQILGAIDAASIAYRTSTQNLASADALMAEERRRARQIGSSFRGGETDRPTLVTAQLEAATTALSSFEAIFRQREALGALEDALQRSLYGPDVMLPDPQATVRQASESST